MTIEENQVSNMIHLSFLMIQLQFSHPNQKYTLEYIFLCLIDFCVSGCCFMKHYKASSTTHVRTGKNIDPISGKYLNELHNKFVRRGYYEELNKDILEAYLKNGREEKLRIQSIDTSFIANKRGSVENNIKIVIPKKSNQKQRKRARKGTTIQIKAKKQSKETRVKKQSKETIVKKQTKVNEAIEEKTIDFNRYNGRKKYFKISTITDSKGITLATTIISSKRSDNVSIEETMEKIPVNLNTLRNSKINRYQQYFLADSGYDSNFNRSLLKSRGYIPIIATNKRNCKDENKLKQKEMIPKHKILYKQRGKIETTFSHIKHYPVLNQMYEKKVESYHGLLLLMTTFYIFKKI